MAMKLIYRPYANEDDYIALRELIIAKFADPDRRFYPSLGDLDYIRSFEEGDNIFQKKVTVCELEDGTIIGAIWPSFYRILYMVTGPQYTHFENEIMAWAEERFCGPSLEDRSGEEVYIWTYEEDKLRSDMLRDRGYSMHTWYMYSGVIDLRADLPEPQFPEGYYVRPLEHSDLDQKLAFMGVSSGLSQPQLEKYRRLMASPTYQQELDLVIVDADGQVVAFANVWHDVHNRIAIIEPFGTMESHRRMGLATNLLYDCMHRLWERGVTHLYINHGGMWTLDPDPDDALRVYRKVGFREFGKMFVWCKTIQ